MRRIVATGAVAALLVGFAGCGEGVEMGVPADAAPPKKIDMSKKFSMTKTQKGKTAKSPPAEPASK